jgi:hypothetical protein
MNFENLIAKVKTLLGWIAGISALMQQVSWPTVALAALILIAFIAHLYFVHVVRLNQYMAMYEAMPPGKIDLGKEVHLEKLKTHRRKKTNTPAKQQNSPLNNNHKTDTQETKDPN